MDGGVDVGEVDGEVVGGGEDACVDGELDTLSDTGVVEGLSDEAVEPVDMAAVVEL